MPKSIYIHIPFCIKKCAYCSFLSGENLQLAGAYTDALVNEINHFYNKKEAKTIYFGGGTPSLLSVEQIEKILKTLNFSADTEITLEANPKTVTLQKLKDFKSLGINRISLGVQTFDDNLLKIIERAHSSKDALCAIDDIKRAGFENFSIDLIYGLPSQSLENWQKTLDIAQKTGAKHISLYGLKIEQGSKFYDKVPNALPDDDLQADMYEAALSALSAWEHYEFSNFAHSGDFCSRHNLTYWNLKSYYGFGLGASGFAEEKRYQNECDMKKYLLNPCAPKVYEKQTAQKLLEEYIFLGFRKCEGINTEQINKKFNINFDEKFALPLKKFLNSGHIQKTLHGYKLTKEGILLSNCVLVEFITIEG